MSPPRSPAVCFSCVLPAPQIAVSVDSQALPRDVAVALSNALPFLRCGEESAVHAFGRRLVHAVGATEQAALSAITLDETRHAAWLEALAASLPIPDAAPDTAAMSAFFRSLLTRDPALHFARVAALDLVVCDILRPLVVEGSPLAAALQVVAGLRSIRHDEARHVRVARECARRLTLGATRQREIDLRLRADLATLMRPVHSSLRRLGVFALDTNAVRRDA